MMLNLKNKLPTILLGQVLFSLPALAQNEMATYKLKRDETISDALWKRGFKPLYGPKGILSQILKYNNITPEDAKNLNPGRTLKVPVLVNEVLMQPVLSPPVISFDSSAEIAIYHLRKDETITNALWDRGFKPLYGPQGILTKILKFNDLTLNDAKFLKPGFALKVPVLLNEELMKPVAPKVARPVLKSEPAPVASTPPSEAWATSSRWSGGLYYFNHRYQEKKNLTFVKTNKDQQLGIDLRNNSQIQKFMFEGQLSITKIQGATFPIEFGIYERVSKSDFVFSRLQPFFTAGYEKFHYLGAEGSNVVTKSFSKMVLGGGVKWDFSIDHKPAYTCLEFLKVSDGAFIHPLIGLNWNERIYSELHYFTVNFQNGDVSGARLNLNLGYRF